MRHMFARPLAGCAVVALLIGVGGTAQATVLNYSVTLNELNNSGVNGGGTLVYDDATGLLSVDYTVHNLADGVHPQHIHGLFDEGVGVPGGTPADAKVPTLANDTDGDGFIEVFEGAATYGDILLSLTQTPGGGDFPDVAGTYHYSQVFDLNDASVFQPPSIATGNTYSRDDLFPLDFREIVIHGGVVAQGEGSGDTGEVQAGTSGYVAVLPVAAGEIRAVGVPEPATLGLLGIGLAGLVAARRRKRT